MTGKFRILFTLVPVLVLLLVVVLAPGGAEARPAEFPVGTYITTITEEDLPPDFPPEVKAFFIGPWVIELTEAGTVIVTKDGEVVAGGRYIGNPARLLLVDAEGPRECLNPGVYRWTFANNELTLTRVHDACINRVIVVTSHPWQKQ